MWGINGVEIVSAFLVLFAIIDVSGSVPIFINLRSQNKIINPPKVAIYSLFFMLLFLFVGEWILRLFQVDISSFAVAGAIVLLILSVEMILGVEIFKNDQSGDSNSSTLVPVVFPLIAGPASFTTLLSMRAEYQTINIIVAILLNLAIVYLVLRFLDPVKRILGASGAYILRKFFGVILMAISIRLLTSNMSTLIASFQ
ncbi:MAG TPA: MarC family protein [Dysgonamonadaceae bacterium]|nr:MarC family protein [Dysgonamonadaceae bacterium]HOT64118.1 MarC family protein [Dysgonamonadaceae bacterium]HOV35448.1 MarC family protein [Dysgonamonadaceae bacterium]HPD43064.1 MarC family protein [Dysgonamonadaceae bacterium]HQG07295.1 MarC family protein [Dysgonamonadaceae bacterium]